MAPLRACAVALSVGWLAGCASPAGSSGVTYAQGEQIVVALSACVPDWITLTSAAIPVNGVTMASIGIIPSAYDLERDEIRCVIAARSDCALVRACFGIELYEDPRCAGGGVTCEGDTLVVCRPPDPVTSAPSVRMRQDCAHEGRVCSPMGMCEDVSCTTPFDCEDDVLVHRCAAVETRRECDPDTSCAGASACVGTGPACTRTTCSAESLRTCDLASHTVSHVIACVDRGSHCQDDGTVARCVPDGHECVPETTRPICIGGALSYCGANGTTQRYDCEGQGFGACETVGPLSDSRTRCGAVGRPLF